jgi:hypothetical protein
MHAILMTVTLVFSVHVFTLRNCVLSGINSSDGIVLYCRMLCASFLANNAEAVVSVRRVLHSVSSMKCFTVK